jgi:hypothetical protein
MGYSSFIADKSQIGGNHGFKPKWTPDFLFDFQKVLVQWAIEKGRAALYEDCGLGKTPQLLVFAENIVRKTNKNVLIVNPLAVSAQTVREGEKFGIECKQSRDGKSAGKITVTNYEKLHLFDPSEFVGMVCDEASAIKNFEGERQKIVTNFISKIPYRLLCTATAAPNDYIELLTSSEALGEMGRMDALGTFFKNDENSLHPIWWGARWRFKQHAEQTFWRWVCSWARTLRKPSDIGFDDGDFVLPPLNFTETVVNNSRPFDGNLFVVAAETLEDQRKERRATIDSRCEEVVNKCAAHEISVAWCHLQEEADLLEKSIPGAVQIQGSDSDEEKEERFLAFANGHIKKLVTKPKCGCFGLNWQHCAHQTYFPSHSFEQFYQSVRRSWRFGQKNPVTVDIITSEGEMGVLKNLQRKQEAATKMFDMLVKYMNDALKLTITHNRNTKTVLPKWL